jgi:hypothetical protein
MTTSCLSILAGIAIVLAAPLPLAAQLPRSMSVPIVFGSPLPDDGLHTVLVRWYADASGGLPLWQESLTSQIISGRCDLILGSVTPLPDTLLRSSPTYLGYSIDNEPERLPRVMILPVASALTAAYAEVAARLDPRASGLVTSINELAGPVSIIGTGGVSIQRQGAALMISSSTVAIESGRIRGDGRSSTYRVRPTSTLQSSQHVTFHVHSPTTHLLGQVRIDYNSNELVFSVSAPLLSEEEIYWSIIP